jgi:hypothetical protein
MGELRLGNVNETHDCRSYLHDRERGVVRLLRYDRADDSRSGGSGKHLVPKVVVTSLILALPVSWFLAPRLRARYWRDRPAPDAL